jgi:predicted small lipoprotein YifL
MKRICLLLASAALTACGQAGPVNPPTEPAQPIDVTDPAAPADDGTVSMMPGRGPTSFVGRWAADVAWCAAPQGAERPIEITSTRFEGYENSCSIAAVDEVVDGYIATLACQSEGQMASERVRFQVTGDVMRLTWLDRGAEAETLRKCTTLEETAAPAAVP